MDLFRFEHQNSIAALFLMKCSKCYFHFHSIYAYAFGYGFCIFVNCPNKKESSNNIKWNSIQ